jgi:hypothetical protein
MKQLFRCSVGAGVMCALIAGGSSACPRWSARVGLNPTEWLATLQQLAQEHRREEMLTGQGQQAVRRLTAKTQVLMDLRDHRLTLLEAAARFRNLESPTSGHYLEWSRLYEPGQTDEERWCRQVIRFLRGHGGELAALAGPFEAELNDHLARGSLHLPFLRDQ